MRIGSLFSGIGGLELGLEWAGVGHTVFQVEWDPFCRSILARHWPDAERFDDVRTVGAHNLPPVDLLCGGYPCQPFSTAGQRNGSDDPRHLWPEFARIIRELRPRFAVLENVAGHLSLGFSDVLGDLAGLGYDAEWFCIRASDVGAPHRRERLFCVAHTSGERDHHRRGPSDMVSAPSPMAIDGGRNGTSGRSARNSGKGVVDSERERLEGAGEGIEQEQIAIDARTRRDGSTVADADMRRCEGERLGRVLDREREALGDDANGRYSAEKLGYSTELRFDPNQAIARSTRESQIAGRMLEPERKGDRIAEPGMGRGPNGVPARVDRWPAGPSDQQHEWEPPRVASKVENRAARLKALGNAVVPQVAEVVGRIVLALDESIGE